MARALCIERAGGRYHVTTRGNERKPIYRTDADRAHFLELLGEAVERFGLGQLAGALDYAALGQAVSRVGRRLEQRGEPRKILAAVEKELSNVEMCPFSLLAAT